MRIALVITELEPGGAEACLVKLAIFLKRRGHSVHVFALSQSPSKTKLIGLLEAEAIPCKFANAKSLLSFLRTTVWLRRQLKSFKPQIVQAMLFHANIVAAVATLGLRTLCIGGARVKPPQRSRQIIQRIMARRMQHFVCVSKSVQAHCREVEKIPESKLSVIPNGIDLQSIPRSPTRPPWLNTAEAGLLTENSPVLLFVGRLDPQKGILELVKDAGNLLADLPHHLVLIGDGPLRAAINEAALHSGVENRVHIFPWQEEPFAWMHWCELLLLPARYEGMPNVILEAMAIGKPVIAYEVDGTRELIGDSTEASLQLAPPENAELLYRQVSDLATNIELRERLGRYNRSRIANHFQLDEQLQKYLDLYESLCPDDAAT